MLKTCKATDEFSCSGTMSLYAAPLNTRCFCTSCPTVQALWNRPDPCPGNLAAHRDSQDADKSQDAQRGPGTTFSTVLGSRELPATPGTLSRRPGRLGTWVALRLPPSAPASRAEALTLRSPRQVQGFPWWLRCGGHCVDGSHGCSVTWGEEGSEKAGESWRVCTSPSPRLVSLPG